MSYFSLLKQKRFLILHLVSFFLLFSLFFSEIGKSIWSSIDITIFRFLNTAFIGHPLQEIFWALANIKITDLYGATFFLFSFLLYVYDGKTKEMRRLRLGYMIYTLLWFEVGILSTKQILTPICEYLHISRHSPTVVLSDTIRLSSFCPWAKIKDVSHFCFPSDHAVIVLQWCLFFTYFAGLSRGIFVSVFSCVFLLPRLISGAHWFSDVAVGSVSVILIVFAWATKENVYNTLMNWLQTKIMRLPQWRTIEQNSQD